MLGIRPTLRKCCNHLCSPAPAVKDSTLSQGQQEISFFAWTTPPGSFMSLALWCPPSSANRSSALRPNLFKMLVSLQCLPVGLSLCSARRLKSFKPSTPRLSLSCRQESDGSCRRTLRSTTARASGACMLRSTKLPQDAVGDRRGRTCVALQDREQIWWSIAQTSH